MKNSTKNILLAIVGVIVLIVLFRLAWMVAGVVARLLFSVIIFAALVALVMYILRQFKR